jgi:hypothetical protein
MLFSASSTSEIAAFERRVIREPTNRVEHAEGFLFVE